VSGGVNIGVFYEQSQEKTPPSEAQNAHGKYETKYFKDTSANC